MIPLHTASPDFKSSVWKAHIIMHARTADLRKSFIRTRWWKLNFIASISLLKQCHANDEERLGFDITSHNMCRKIKTTTKTTIFYFLIQNYFFIQTWFYFLQIVANLFLRHFNARFKISLRYKFESGA